jgi:hypothetical protein
MSLAETVALQPAGQMMYARRGMIPLAVGMMYAALEMGHARGRMMYAGS